MKHDRYLKTVLTVIALCLLWIVFREVPIAPKAYAKADTENQIQHVLLLGTDPNAFRLAEPISVEISNIAEFAQLLTAQLGTN